MVIVVGTLTIFLAGLLLTAAKRKLILILPKEYPHQHADGIGNIADKKTLIEK
jgi:hypothetical protein